MRIEPQTIENDLIASAHALREASDYFLQTDDVRWRRLLKDAQKLREANPARGWSVMGELYALVGDSAKMESAFSNSMRLERNPTTVANWIGNCVTLGHFSAAQELFREKAHPVGGAFCYLYDVGISAGAYESAVEYIQIAQDMNIDLSNIDTNIPLNISSILGDFGVPQADVVRHLDLAGEILRQHRIPAAPAYSAAQTPGVFSGVTVAFHIPVNQSEAFDMNVELAQAEENQQIVKNIAFDVVFTATK